MNARARDFFFSGVKNPANASEVITLLAAGKVLEVARLPEELLAPVVLLSTIGLRAYGQQIVDDYSILIDRMKELFRESRVNGGYWHPQLFLVAQICDAGPTGEFFLEGSPDAAYIFGIYESLVNADLDELFGKGEGNGEARRRDVPMRSTGMAPLRKRKNGAS